MQEQSQYGGIRLTSLAKEVVDRLLTGTTDYAKVATRPGVCAQALLNLPANLVNGDVLTIEGVTFEVDIINTDSGVNTADVLATGALNGTDDTSLVTLGAAPATAINAGDFIRIENEIMKVMRKLSTTQYVVKRARCGTTLASHAQNLDVFVSDAVITSGNIPVGLVTTLTPAVFGPALVQEFNNLARGAFERPVAKASPTTLTDAWIAHPVLSAGQQILFTKRTAGADVTALTEEFANSTDNVWSAATNVGGQAAGVLASEVSERVPTAVEELLGEMHFAFPFTARFVQVNMRVTATGQQVFFNGAVQKGYVESTDATLPATIVTVRNVGPASTAYITPFASTHTVQVVAWE
jgi:hypothetical protein